MVAPANGRPHQSLAVTANVAIAAAAESTATSEPEDRTDPGSAGNVTVNSRHGFRTVNTSLLSTRSAPGPSTSNIPTITPTSIGRKITTDPSITRTMTPPGGLLGHHAADVARSFPPHLPTCRDIDLACP